MLVSIKKTKTILFASLLAILSVGVSFLIFGISVWVGGTKLPYYFFLMMFIFIYAFLAYLSGDLRIISYRKQVQEYNPVIPDDVQEEIWDRRTPFILALIATILVLAVFFIIRLSTGVWPFLA